MNGPPFAVRRLFDGEFQTYCRRKFCWTRTGCNIPNKSISVSNDCKGEKQTRPFNQSGLHGLAAHHDGFGVKLRGCWLERSVSPLKLTPLKAPHGQKMMFFQWSVVLKNFLTNTRNRPVGAEWRSFIGRRFKAKSWPAPLVVSR